MSYLASEQINVFPAVRRKGYVESRITTESAFANIVNSLLDTNGFLITDNASSGILEFNIGGYYFKINDITALTALFPSATAGTKIYGVISLASIGNNRELEGYDNELGQYEGINFTTTKPISGLYLSLMEKGSDSTWDIDYYSLIKFDNDSLDIVVDGGEI